MQYLALRAIFGAHAHPHYGGRVFATEIILECHVPNTEWWGYSWLNISSSISDVTCMDRGVASLLLSTNGHHQLAGGYHLYLPPKKLKILPGQVGFSLRLIYQWNRSRRKMILTSDGSTQGWRRALASVHLVY